ncbi:hypothetical protein I4I73_03460 [Pseudonocardia sp. KRD-184]|uniref:Uncharacterized protein n=1 Tax=Pseudonocardia oceani TaxID=2792013 RepID=A0ABS6UKY8_9PSEU|nr:hypothetical protein [Pseudonocardia oceani]MBW0088273.1 hypothetical protein [Pseudonocardia oceani]MBW0095055.1 hypothetical protein [Pseudonocardia oceani]MBW0121092.1 hypothetical protein [Pseudonocardia oceani]MBW0131222.1 hypothetical protein [Pseudonocardia oceani]MBW0132611.1 hypothetical protein [Pseudonocardia oceani]
MPRGGKRIELPPKPCQNPDCDALFHRGADQTTTQYSRQKFCSTECREKAGPPIRQRRDICGKSLHPMVGDNILHTGNGGRRCRACNADRDATRRDRQPGARSGGRTIRRGPRRAAPAPAPVVQVDGPRWRPAGFTPEPSTWHAGQVAS